MSVSALSSELRHRTVVKRPLGELQEILASAVLLRECDTKLAGWLRVFRFEGEIVFQEEHPEHRCLLLRRMSSPEDAEALVRDRVETYERMWDGCGCKVDYYG